MTTTALAALKQRLWAEIDRRRDELARLCADSLAVPAENPPGDTTAIADHFARILRHVGLGVERFRRVRRPSPTPRGRPHPPSLSGRRPGPRAGFPRRPAAR